MAARNSSLDVSVGEEWPRTQVAPVTSAPRQQSALLQSLCHRPPWSDQHPVEEVRESAYMQRLRMQIRLVRYSRPLQEALLVLAKQQLAVRCSSKQQQADCVSSKGYESGADWHCFNRFEPLSDSTGDEVTINSGSDEYSSCYRRKPTATSYHGRQATIAHASLHLRAADPNEQLEVKHWVAYCEGAAALPPVPAPHASVAELLPRWRNIQLHLMVAVLGSTVAPGLGGYWAPPLEEGEKEAGVRVHSLAEVQMHFCKALVGAVVSSQLFEVFGEECSQGMDAFDYNWWSSKQERSWGCFQCAIIITLFALLDWYVGAKALAAPRQHRPRKATATAVYNCDCCWASTLSNVPTKAVTDSMSSWPASNPKMHTGLLGGGRSVGGDSASKLSAGVGYRNLGRTCYLNAVLQGLGHVPSIGAHVAHAACEHTSDECAFCCFRNVLFPVVSHSQEAAVSPEELLEHLQTFQRSRGEQECKFEVGSDQDAFECYVRLLELLQQQECPSAQVCGGLAICGMFAIKRCLDGTSHHGDVPRLSSARNVSSYI